MLTFLLPEDMKLQPRPGDSVFLVFVTRAGSTVSLGRHFNRVSVTALTDSGRRLKGTADPAPIIVEDSPVFWEEGTIIGTVFLDCDANGVQTSGADEPDAIAEPGVPGVRIVFENGVSATTDAFGRYSVYGFEAVTHVARIDSVTLPAGVRPRLIENRQALHARSRFVDLNKGELHRADFALGPCNDSVSGEIEGRRVQMLDKGASWDDLLNRELSIGLRSSGARSDSARRMARGVVSPDGQVQSTPKPMPEAGREDEPTASVTPEQASRLWKSPRPDEAVG